MISETSPTGTIIVMPTEEVTVPVREGIAVFADRKDPLALASADYRRRKLIKRYTFE